MSQPSALRKRADRVCEHCGATYSGRADFPQQRFCSKRCKYDWLKAQPRQHTPQEIRRLTDDEPLPVGVPRRYKAGNGYIVLRWKVGVRSYVERLEHRHIAGCDKPEVHHRNGQKDDNSESNLKQVTSLEHGEEHATWPIAEACELYRQGWSLPRLAAKYGKGTTLIMRALKLRGVQMRTISEASKHAVDEGAIIRLWYAGLGRRQIAAQLSIGEAVVARVFREQGMKRGPGRVRRSA